jgi:alkyl hydroperoxide reductase subunit AhpC
VPEVEQLLPRFRAAHTQVLGISVDSVYCHANWARSLGGISYPLLADFEPKGEVGRKYGLYLDGPGIDDRATVIVDSSGVVRHASTVGPGGRRNIAELATLCETVDAEHGGGLEDFPAPPGLPKGGSS